MKELISGLIILLVIIGATIIGDPKWDSMKGSNNTFRHTPPETGDIKPDK